VTDVATRPPDVSAGPRAPRIGESAPRPDGVPKAQGRFAFGSDLWAEGMVWGATLRSPHPSAAIRSIDVGPALAIAGVRAVVTADDVPGDLLYGLEHADQPVFARDEVRYAGEPVAAVAADHPETARQALAAIVVDYDVRTPLVDAEEAVAAGEVFRHLTIRHGDPDATGDVVVEGTYEVGMQDQAFMGPECGLAIPDHDGGGVELFISTQFLHVDRKQVAACLGLPEDHVRLTLAGVGGAFGAREDVSLHVHCCLLALRTGRPVKMTYSRPESFHGHVHRHPARMWYRHHATSAGDLVKVEARILLDGGAYASTSMAVTSNAACFAAGPYRVPHAVVDGFAARTNNPPCGAMRGFGAVQTCFAHEAQMDRLAAALGVDPVELRLRNALATGDTLITGQQLRGAAPVAEVIEACAAAPLPDLPAVDDLPMMARPGGAGRTADPSGVCRGVGFAVGFKNLMFSEGFDDYSTARCDLVDGVATITCACAEVGQGFVTLVQQIGREVLDIDEVIVAPAETATIGSAGSTSASRQTWMSGGAVEAACRAVRDQVLGAAGGDEAALHAAMAGRSFTATVEHHHAPTQPLDADGQGDAHVSFAFAAHRAVVDVDVELGLIRVQEITTAQDVGRVLNPLQALGQVEGGIAQGVGLAVMEEIVLDEGRIRNPSFTDYLIPTALDMPAVTVAALIEEPEPGAPFGAKGIGEPPTISSTAAVAAAVRDATGLDLPRVPIRPQDIALADPVA
jgi:CO/xanthine dehydrogenase Mo-binding subunit